MYYEVCNCTTLPYTELWLCKKHIKSKAIHAKLRELANPACKKCHGNGKCRVY